MSCQNSVIIGRVAVLPGQSGWHGQPDPDAEAESGQIGNPRAAITKTTGEAHWQTTA